MDSPSIPTGSPQKNAPALAPGPATAWPRGLHRSRPRWGQGSHWVKGKRTRPGNDQ